MTEDSRYIATRSCEQHFRVTGVDHGRTVLVRLPRDACLKSEFPWRVGERISTSMHVPFVLKKIWDLPEPAF